MYKLEVWVARFKIYFILYSVDLESSSSCLNIGGSFEQQSVRACLYTEVHTGESYSPPTAKALLFSLGAIEELQIR